MVLRSRDRGRVGHRRHLIETPRPGLPGGAFRLSVREDARVSCLLRGQCLSPAPPSRRRALTAAAGTLLVWRELKASSQPPNASRPPRSKPSFTPSTPTTRIPACTCAASPNMRSSSATPPTCPTHECRSVDARRALSRHRQDPRGALRHHPRREAPHARRAARGHHPPAPRSRRARATRGLLSGSAAGRARPSRTMERQRAIRAATRRDGASRSRPASSPSPTPSTPSRTAGSTATADPSMPLERSCSTDAARNSIRSSSISSSRPRLAARPGHATAACRAGANPSRSRGPGRRETQVPDIIFRWRPGKSATRGRHSPGRRPQRAR